MLIFIKILKCHVKALLLPGKGTVVVLLPVMEILPYFYSVGLHFFPIFISGRLKLLIDALDKNYFILLFKVLHLFGFFSVCVYVLLALCYLKKKKKKRKKCDTRTVAIHQHAGGISALRLFF